MNTEQDASAPMATEPQAASASTATMPSSVSPLADLPVELFYRVARPLSTVDFCALRLTCRAVEQRLFQTFSREFFSRKQFMMSGPSLQALIDIAHHPHLSAKLQHVTIGLECLGTCVLEPHDPSGDYHLCQEALADQTTLFSSGRAVEMLAEAFKNLPNLKTVSIRDAPSRTRFRDFNSGLKFWNSYGYPTLEKKVNLRYINYLPDETSIFSANVFSALTAALARSGARPENIEMIMRDRSRGLPDRAFYIPSTEAERARHKTFMSGLRKLHLCIVLDGRGGSTGHDSFIGGRIQGTNRAIHAVVSHFDASHYIAQSAPNIEWLRLNFHETASIMSPRTAIVETFLTSWAYGMPNTAGAKQTKEEMVVYPKLKRLDVGFAAVSAKGLWRVLKNLPALEQISLHNVTLSAGKGPESLLPEWVQDEMHLDPSSMVWQSFLNELSRAVPSLKHVEISGPMEESGARMDQVVMGTEDYNFAIHVEADENLADECAKAAAQLSYKAAPIHDSDIGETDEELSDDPEGDDDNDDEDEDNEEMEE